MPLVDKVTNRGNQNPLFLRFLNRDITARDIVQIASRSEDASTSAIAAKALDRPPDLTEFHQELEEAVRDLVAEGLGEEFKAFVNYYMEPSLEEDAQSETNPFGENRSCSARVKDAHSPWVQGLICYNLCLYIKAFGLDELKACKVCGKIFSHKGRYAVYCSDSCKASKNKPS